MSRKITVLNSGSSYVFALLLRVFGADFFSQVLGQVFSFFRPLVQKKTFNFIISNITARKKGKRQLPFLQNFSLF
ncbi:hypothetical protein LEP1GSC133_4111 [Leptospira borgpetersenii serovar Pomona str. 200901868]|uniref:Uncharacterized protein n=1 Tax=Leptospira borgpetersenii serovar Pomona str. 200901868 TaxID=1192866 RepID=M6W1V9_LEPBO|nr:hypothetical protein LEP1GSC133_4111 [Leptospira borgpetersenii serovar Pomona str. 200901868]